MAHPYEVGEGTEGAVGFGSVQGAEVGVALAVGVEEVRLDEELDPPSPGSVSLAVRLAGDRQRVLIMVVIAWSDDTRSRDRRFATQFSSPANHWL